MNTDPGRRKIIQVLLVFFLLAALGLLAYAYFSRYDRFNTENLEAFVDSFGPWALAVFVAVYMIGSPIPMLSTIFSAAGGLVFGPVAGPFVVVLTATVSSLIPFLLARSFGREWVEERLQGKRFEEIYRQSEGGKGFTFILMMRLIPVIPWEIQNYLAGLTKISIPTFLLATMLGIIPLSTALVLLGASVRDPGSWQFFAAIGLTVVVMLIPIIVMAIRRKRNEDQE